jgi:hypothetical protein
VDRMSKSATILVVLILLEAAWFGCGKERVTSPGAGGDGPARVDSSGIWLDVAPDRASIFIFLRGRTDTGVRYVLQKAAGDTAHYYDASFTMIGFGVWDDTGVGEGRTYYYRVLSFFKGQPVGATAAVRITFRSPEYAVRQIGLAYGSRDLDLLQGLLAGDYEYDGRKNDGSSVAYGRDMEIAIHRKMFSPAEFGTGLETLSLSIGKISCGRVTNEEDYLQILCFEAVADVELHVDFDKTLTNNPSMCFKGKETFRIKH